MKSYSLWINKKKIPKIYEKIIKYKKNNKTVLVKTIYSGISKGTEKLVSSKLVNKDQFELMKAPFQEGSFDLPIKYGYINIGKIVDGPKQMLNKNIFSLFPHQSLYEIPIKNISILPNRNIKKFLLTANMETAINIFWDSMPNKKDKIIIIGLGSVGILTAYYFQLRKFNQVYVYDSNLKKKSIAKYLKFKFIDFNKIKSADIVINTSSDYNILANSMKILSNEGKFIEASWYGNKKGLINLGGHFHSKRLKIISSQVSQIPIHLKDKYDFNKRLKLAINALKNDKLKKLITSESTFFNLEKDYCKIINNKNTIMHLIKY
tara:strand:+ start:22 stop:981 length:960 start_codon:yes stop_codon:yes gene_type:complete